MLDKVMTYQFKVVNLLKIFISVFNYGLKGRCILSLQGFSILSCSNRNKYKYEIRLELECLYNDYSAWMTEQLDLYI